MSDPKPYRCYGCNEEIPVITPQEDLIYGVTCPGCGSRRMNLYSTEEWICMLSNRISELERRLTNDLKSMP